MIPITLAAVLLSFGTGVAFASFDLTRKQASRHLPPVPLLLAICAGQIPCFAIWLVIAGDWRFSPDYVLPGVLAWAVALSSNLLFLRSVQLSPLSLTVPLLSVTPAFSAALAHVVLDEIMRPRQLVGVGLVVAGVFLLFAPAFRLRDLPAAGRALLAEPGAPLMLAVAFLWSLLILLDKVLSQETALQLHLLIQISAMTATLLPVWLWTRRRRPAAPSPEPGKRLFWVAAAALSGALALGLQLLALQVALVGVVESVKRVVGQLSALIAGRIAFGEPITPPKIAGILFMAVGVPAIVWPA